ncbi:MAG: glycosyltransferase [Gelidibacter sp.]
MNITEETNIPLEILIATMNRGSLDFLDEMFINTDSSKCHLLIINQTTPELLLASNKPNIRVINSFERGLSKSRNLALQNAKGDIVLIADDDIVFEEGFFKHILQSFKLKTEAAMITFIAMNLDGTPYRNYRKSAHWHDFKSIHDVISWEIAFRVQRIKDLNIQFDENFGLGSIFQTGEEYIFVRDVLIAGGKCYFENVPIVSHPEYSSGKDEGSDRLVYARAAIQYKVNKGLSYLWLPKYLFFLLRHDFIRFDEIRHKLAQGLKGIQDYKKIRDKRLA